MKKSLVVAMAGIMLVSSVSFARGNQGQYNMGYNRQSTSIQEENMDSGRGNIRSENREDKFDNLTDEQQEQIKEIVSNDADIMKEQHLNIQQKEIEIQKEELNDEIDWTRVEVLLKEVEEIKTEVRLEQMKNHDEIKDIVGEDFFAFGGFGQRNGDGGNRPKGRGGNNRGNDMNNNNSGMSGGPRSFSR